MVTLQRCSIQWRENGHLIEVVTLMVGTLMVMLQKGPV